MKANGVFINAFYTKEWSERIKYTNYGFNKYTVNELKKKTEEAGFAFNHYFIQTMLREKMGFKGYINSGSGIVNNMCWGVEDKSISARFAKAINSGVDMVADTNDVENLKEAIENGWISEKRKEKREKMKGKKVYVEVFHKDTECAITYTEKARKECSEVGAYELTDNFKEADVAYLFLAPKSGEYFNATPGYLELAICEDKDEVAIDGSAYKETTLSGISHLNEVTKDIHSRDGKVIISVNIILPWLLDFIEPMADSLVAGYDTFYKAQFDVFAGNYNPVGVLPLTLPASEKVIAIDEKGNCISRNDVPGYDKDKYMPEGIHYAYVDGDGNEYKLDYGIRW